MGLINWFKKKSSPGTSKYRDLPTIPRDIELKGLTNNFGVYGERMIKNWEDKGIISNSSKVLDIGCGNGRIGMPFAYYLKEGSYYGLDIDKNKIDWLVNNVTSKFPRIKFIFSDVYNGMYNPSGKVDASEYRLPFDDESFDFVFLISVFTHMIKEDIENYLKEIYRVLKKGGKCWISYFVIDSDALGKIDEGTAGRPFKIDMNDYRIVNEDQHESAVGYNENYLKEIYISNGFSNIRIKKGRWRESFLDRGSQDTVIAEK